MQAGFQAACDWKLVLQQLQFISPADSNEVHADLLSRSRHILANCGFQFMLHHVNGHQDDQANHVLSQDKALNMEADLLAKTKLNLNQQGLVGYQIPHGHGT